MRWKIILHIRSKSQVSYSLIPSTYSLASSSLYKLFTSRNSMTKVGLLSFTPKTSSFILLSIKQGAYRKSSFRVSSVAAPVKDVAGFDDMIARTQRKYYMLGGKGGVRKTSCAASLAVKFANILQQINPDKAQKEFDCVTQKSGGTGVKDFMEGMGLGTGELKLEELLDTPPPGLDEAMAIAKFLESQEYSLFTQIVFDTVPTGHTLRLLSLLDFLDASIGKILKLSQKITSATSAIKCIFSQEQTSQQDVADKLERLRERN